MLKRFMAIICALTMLAAVAAGCSGTTSTASSVTPPASSKGAAPAVSSAPAAPVEEPPFRITIHSQGGASLEPHTRDSRVIKTIEEYTNTILEVTWSPNSGYSDRLNIMMASGDVPMITQISHEGYKHPIATQAIRGGIFWEAGPYFLEDPNAFPNLYQAHPLIRQVAQVDGKDYGVVHQRDFVRSGYFVRKDWLDKLGLKEPTTFKELEEMFYAFTFKDPDGNGLNDTFGLTMTEDSGSELMWRGVVIFHGGPNQWGEKDGMLQPDFMFDEYIDAMNWMRKLKNDGVLNQDWPLTPRTVVVDYFCEGKSGSYGIMNQLSVLSASHKPLYELNPGAEIDSLMVIKDVNDELRLYPTAGFSGVYMLGKKALPKEEDMLRALKFLDMMCDQEMQELIDFGYEGEHFKALADGKVEIIDQEGYASTCYDIAHLSPQYPRDVKRECVFPYPLSKVHEFIKSYDDYAVVCPVDPFLSDTYTQVGATLQQMIEDAKVKYILGDMEIDEFKAVVQRWRNEGGDQIIAEYTKQWKAANS